MSLIERFHKIIRISGPETTLTRSQREFNRLLERVETLETELATVRAVVDHLQQRLQRDYFPLLRLYHKQRAELVRLLDRAIQSGDFKQAETRKLTGLLLSFAQELIGQEGFDDLTGLYERYAPADTLQDTASTTPDTESAATPDQRDDSSASRPRSQKKKEREQKQALTLLSVTKTVRMIYTDLVKAFHPDRESDETEKERKNKIMHRVTEAYQKGDLLALLRLQLEYEQIDQAHLTALADEKLQHYNRILRQQVQGLESELADQQAYLVSLGGKPGQSVGSGVGLEIGLNQDINSLKKATKDLKADLKALANPGVLRQWLTLY